MKRFVMLALVLMFAVSCDDDSPTSPSDPNVARFTAILLPSNEVPPIPSSSPDGAASGTMQLTMTVTRDAANNITGATYDFTVHTTGFPANTILTGAHIHQAPAGMNSGVVVGLPLTSADTTLSSGQATIIKNGVTANNPATAASVAQSIFNNPAGNYFNVHTSINTGGAIRGQLVRTN